MSFLWAYVHQGSLGQDPWHSPAPCAGFEGHIRILGVAIWDSPNLGVREGKSLTVLWDLFCSCRGQKARTTQLSKHCARSHLFIPHSHVQPCLCNGRESAYQSLIPKSQEGQEKPWSSLLFIPETQCWKSKVNSILCWCAHIVWGDLSQWHGWPLLPSIVLSVVNGDGWVLQTDLRSTSLDMHHVKCT